MPIFRQPNRPSILFVHIPKTAGSSIEKWLRQAGYRMTKYNTWDGSVAQHALPELYETWGEFDYKFAVVRHPVERFLSALRHHSVPPHRANAKAKELLPKFLKDPNSVPSFKTFLVPQVAYMSEGLEVFKFEEDFFQQLGDKLNIAGPYPHENKRRSPIGARDLTNEAKELVYRVYEEDFKRFGYSL